MKLPNTLLAIVLPCVLIIALSCSKESFIPPSPIDAETSLSSDDSDPRQIRTDSLDAGLDWPGGIGFIDPDSSKGDDQPPVITSAPETILDTLSAAYGKRDLDLFAQCLANDFRFYPANSAEYWDRRQEISIHEHMFNPDFQAREWLRGADFLSASFTLLSKGPYGDLEDNRWSLTCRAVWWFWNIQMVPKPLAIRNEGNVSFVVGPSPERPGRWLIETWREEVGQTRFMYQP